MRRDARQLFPIAQKALTNTVRQVGAGRPLVAATAVAVIAGCVLWGGDAPPRYPSRTADLDVVTRSQAPPPGYGEVAFYWWLVDPLTKERLTWHLDQLKDKGVTALHVKYAHSDKGGTSMDYPLLASRRCLPAGGGTCSAIQSGRLARSTVQPNTD